MKIELNLTDENNHIMNYSQEFLSYLKSLLSGFNCDNQPDELNFRVKETSQFVTIINHKEDDGIIWLKTEELSEWIKRMNDINVQSIDTINFGYISGVKHPFSTIKGTTHGADYYEVWAKITYKK